MAFGVNKVILIGNVGRDPELRYTAGGTAVAKFSLATSEAWGKGESRKERTEWHRIVCWGKQAEFCGEYVKKGSKLYVEGRIQTRDWEDKEGQKRYTTEIVANTLQFVGSKRDEGRGGGGPDFDNANLDRFIDEMGPAAADGGWSDDEDVPF